MKKELINFSCILYGIYLYLCIYFKRHGASHVRYPIIPAKIGGFAGDFIFSSMLTQEFCLYQKIKIALIHSILKNNDNSFSIEMGMVSTITPLLITSIHA